MITFPNAKINLGLYVERKREDGYHDLSTVFYPIPLTDAVEVVEAKKPRCSPMAIRWTDLRKKIL